MITQAYQILLEVYDIIKSLIKENNVVYIIKDEICILEVFGSNTNLLVAFCFLEISQKVNYDRPVCKQTG